MQFRTFGGCVPEALLRDHPDLNGNIGFVEHIQSVDNESNLGADWDISGEGQFASVVKALSGNANLFIPVRKAGNGR